MHVTHGPDGTHVLSCTDFELDLIAEGLYAVEGTSGVASR